MSHAPDSRYPETLRVSVRMPYGAGARIQRAADAAGMTRGAWIRAVLLREATRALARARRRMRRSE